MPTRTTSRLLAIAGVALIIRLAAAQLFVGLASEPRGSAQPDQIDYEYLAWSVVSNGRYAMPNGAATAHRPPGTSLMLLPVYATVGRSFAVARVWFCVLGAATCIFTGLLARALFRSETAGLAAASLLAVYPGHFYYSLHFVSEVPFGLFTALALWLVMTPVSSSRWRLAADLGAGASAGLAALTRPQMLLLPALAAAVAVVVRPGRAALARAAVVAAAFALCLAPWVARNVAVMGRATLSTVGGYTFWGAHNRTILAPELTGLWVRTSDLTDPTHPLTDDEVANEAASWRYGMEFVRTHMGDMPRLVTWKLIRLVAPFEPTSNRAVYWAFAIAWIAIAPLVIVGIREVMRAGPTAASVALLPLATTLVTVLIFYGSIRFRDSNAPVLAALAGGGAAALLGRLRRTTAS